MRNIFVEKPCTKWGGETSLRPFFKKNKIQHSSGSTVWYYIQFDFIVRLSRVLPKHTQTKALNTCFYFTQSF